MHRIVAQHGYNVGSVLNLLSFVISISDFDLTMKSQLNKSTNDNSLYLSLLRRKYLIFANQN